MAGIVGPDAGARRRCPRCNFAGDPGDATCARCGAPLHGARGRGAAPPLPADVQAFARRSVAARASETARRDEWRWRRNVIDVVGGGLAYAATFWLWFGSPFQHGSFGPFVVSVGLGTAAGALTAWQRGAFGALTWGVAAMLDWALVSGMGGMFRFLVNLVLGLALAFSRRMDRMEGF